MATTRGLPTDAVRTRPSAFSSTRPSAFDLDSIVPPPKDEDGNLFGDILDIGSDAALLPIRALMKVSAAEQKYISRPLARAVYNDAIRQVVNYLGPDLPEYDNLPDIVQQVGENILSPSTWIGPGAAAKAVRYLPRFGASIPTLGAQALSLGSRKGLSYLAANRLQRILWQGPNPASYRGVLAGAVAAPIGATAAEEIGLPGLLGAGAAGIAGYRLGRTRPKLGPDFNDLDDFSAVSSWLIPRL
jgi:hypothetical protein